MCAWRATRAADKNMRFPVTLGHPSLSSRWSQTNLSSTLGGPFPLSYPLNPATPYPSAVPRYLPRCLELCEKAYTSDDAPCVHALLGFPCSPFLPDFGPNLISIRFQERRNAPVFRTPPVIPTLMNPSKLRTRLRNHYFLVPQDVFQGHS